MSLIIFIKIFPGSILDGPIHYYLILRLCMVEDKLYATSLVSPLFDSRRVILDLQLIYLSYLCCGRALLYVVAFGFLNDVLLSIVSPLVLKSQNLCL